MIIEFKEHRNARTLYTTDHLSRVPGKGEQAIFPAPKMAVWGIDSVAHDATNGNAVCMVHWLYDVDEINGR